MSGRHTIQRAVNLAMRQRGTPYVWGGSAPGGFDCSGLVYWAYRQAGYTGIGRTTYDQIKQGIPVSASQLKPGDIVFPSHEHEGLYIGNGMVLEAPHTGDHVKVIPLSSFGFLTARRLIHGGGGVVPPRAIGGVHGGTGLPVPSPNPADRMPHPQANAAAALAAMLASHEIPKLPHLDLNLPRPADVLARLTMSGSAPAQLPGQQQSALPVAATDQQPKLLPLQQTVTPGGRTIGEASASLDAIRRRLSGVA